MPLFPPLPSGYTHTSTSTSMRLQSSLSLATVALAGTAAATGTLELSISKRDASGNPSDVARGMLVKRQNTAGTVEESVYDVLTWSTGGAYYTNISVGTPPQVQTVILDTGSSDLYLDSRSSTACTESRADLNSCRGGTYDTGASSTYKTTIEGGFNTSFGDGSTATGDFGTDVVQIGDVTLQNVQLGVARDVESTTGYAIGLMGVGYSFNEASERVYPNMPEVLKDAGAINSRLYSVFLNDFGAATGTILFGGIDTSKYTGQLHTLNCIGQPVQASDDEVIYLVYEFVVAVTGLNASVSGKTTSYFSNGDPTGQDGDSLQVLLDTGSAAWTVPTRLYNDIASSIPNLDRYGNLPCSSQSSDISLSIEFGGQVTIDVPLRELVVPVYDAATNVQNTTSDGEPLCTFMLSPGETSQDQPFLTLGDSILRSMYVVFDLDNGQVSIAQAAINSTTDASSSGSGSSVKVVQAGPDGVRNAVGSSGVVTASANTQSIAPQVSTTASFGLQTTEPAVGTATGTDALPTEARVSATAGGSSKGGSRSSGSTASSGSTSTSKGAASALSVPRADWTMGWMVLVASVGFCMGALTLW